MHTGNFVWDCLRIAVMGLACCLARRVPAARPRLAQAASAG